MLRKVLSLVRPSSTNLAFVSTRSAMVLNFQSTTPIGPSLANRLAQTLLPESCRLMFSMRPLTARYSPESGGRSGRAFSQADLAPCQSPACPASLACWASASNCCACVSRPQAGQVSASADSAPPQFEHRLEMTGTTKFHCNGPSRRTRNYQRYQRLPIKTQAASNALVVACAATASPIRPRFR